MPAHAPSARRSFTMLCRSLLIPSFLVALSSCGLRDEPTFHPDIIPEGARGFCQRLGWERTCSVPEYPDEQRLNTGLDAYGPYAWIVPAPFLDTLTSFSNDGLGVHVAGILVDTARAVDLPDSYDALKLSAGMNCVYLRRVNPTLWRAYIKAEEPTGTTPCPSNYSAADSLSVSLVTDPMITRPEHVPPVARFHEGAWNNRPRQPFFGLKCGAAWCAFLPEGMSIPPTVLGVLHPTELVWRVPGWRDVQQLAVTDAAAGLVYSTTISASIVPGPGTQLRGLASFDTGYVHMATVHFGMNPTGTKYDTSWHFTQGENLILLRRDPTADTWSGIVQNARGERYPVDSVARFDHNIYPPKVARWRWIETDEGVWVACDDGCCQVAN